MAKKLSKLGEESLACIISSTTPRDACHFTVVSTLFRTAADSDTVWERFLPPDHQSIIATSDDNTQSQLLLILHDHPSKKQLFMRLADSPILVNAGCRSFFLDKASGKKCFMISAKDIFIVRGYTPMYWELVSFPSSRFAEVAKLRMVCCLEISLCIEASLLSPKTTYMSYLVYKLTDDSVELDCIPLRTSVSMADGVKNYNTRVLAPEDDVYRQLQRPVQLLLNSSGGSNGHYPKRRADGWLEAELGEVFIDGDMVEVWVGEVKHNHCKHGLLIEGIEFRPKA